VSGRSASARKLQRQVMELYQRTLGVREVAPLKDADVREPAFAE
jgi:hypothetical protein